MPALKRKASGGLSTSPTKRAALQKPQLSTSPSKQRGGAGQRILKREDSEDELNAFLPRTRSGKVRPIEPPPKTPPRRKLETSTSHRDIQGDETESRPTSPTKRGRPPKAEPKAVKSLTADPPRELAKSSPRKTISPARSPTPPSVAESIEDVDPELEERSELQVEAQLVAEQLRVFTSESGSPLPMDDRPISPALCDARRQSIFRAIQSSDCWMEPESSANHIALKQLHDLLTGTVVRGEGNSCLLLGPRGSGKTGIVDRCIGLLEEKPIIIKLCGWVQHTDKLAMREIAYQIDQQTGGSFLIEDEGAEVDPFLETPTGIHSGQPPATHLSKFISSLPTLSRATVVVLDGFDLFAQHPRQSLLYCLLDTVQSCRAEAGKKGIAVIGTTARVDTINILEKRVKSRFSGRMFRTASPGNWDDWRGFTRKILCQSLESFADFDGQWERAVDSFLQDELTQSVFKETLSVTRDVRVFNRILTAMVVQLSPDAPYPTPKQLAHVASMQRTRVGFPSVEGLPYPALCLLVACMHSETAGHSIFTFEMLYERVRDQIRVSASAPVEVKGTSVGMPQCSRAVLSSAFETLVCTSIFIPSVAPAAGIAKEFAKYRSHVGREWIRRALQLKNDMNLNRWLGKS
ncbi:unnamed protein product [Mycena citricolor]|uniref:Origin recognition complex subunit 4 n=1 Tax=Mycena citricolor TaxID=2018698 RepID=A0AAD2JW72_9AGAR|nr:unnamed protein product [Mycena citricolor]